jgi:hypothetical protein
VDAAASPVRPGTKRTRGRRKAGKRKAARGKKR